MNRQFFEKSAMVGGRILFAVAFLATVAGISIVASVLTTAIVGGNAHVPEGFSEKRFREIAPGDSIETVEQKLGEPLWCRVLEKKDFRDKLFSGQERPLVDLKGAREWSKDPRVFLVLDYSRQKYSFWPYYTYWSIEVRDGRVSATHVSTLD